MTVVVNFNRETDPESESPDSKCTISLSLLTTVLKQDLRLFAGTNGHKVSQKYAGAGPHIPSIRNSLTVSLNSNVYMTVSHVSIP